MSLLAHLYVLRAAICCKALSDAGLLPGGQGHLPTLVGLAVVYQRACRLLSAAWYTIFDSTWADS